jgi:hypothetical protein
MALPGDRFYKPIYFVEDAGIFLTVERGRFPAAGDYVATGEVGESFTVELYHGQPHDGAVTFLHFWAFHHSEQWQPRPALPY